MNDVLIKYYSARMLGTLDMNHLVNRLFDAFGECRISLEQMTPEERTSASTLVAGIVAVNERFWVLEQTSKGLERRHALEAEVMRLGQK